MLYMKAKCGHCWVALRDFFNPRELNEMHCVYIIPTRNSHKATKSFIKIYRFIGTIALVFPSHVLSSVESRTYREKR